MPLFSADDLLSLTRRILEAAGTPPSIAARVAAILVNANLAGHDSHGILRIPVYMRQIESGTLLPAEEPETLRETAATALVDARQGWGHYAAERATDLALRKAAEAGSCTVVLRRCNHIGRLGEFVARAAEAGFVASVSVGHAGRGRGCAAPYGGTECSLGTNPFAFGVPTGGDTPFVVDFATTVAAEGKIQVARSKGALLPDGWIVDRDGAPSRDPADFYDGGSLLFAGGHKGYAMSLFASLSAALNGTFEPDGWGIAGVVIQAADPRAFLPLEEFRAAVRGVLAGIKSVRPAGGGEVLFPGEPERRAWEVRSARGIEVPASVWGQVREEAGKLGVAPEVEPVAEEGGAAD